MSTVGLEADLTVKARTYKILKKQRKQTEMSQNVLKFGKQRLGVHGQDLPPFASVESQAADARLKQTIDQHAYLKSVLATDFHGRKSDTINWWEQRSKEFYNPIPEETSLRMFQTKNKWYAKPDAILISDIKDVPAAQDSFKSGRVIVKKSVAECALKPGQVERATMAQSGQPMRRKKAELNRFSTFTFHCKQSMREADQKPEKTATTPVVQFQETESKKYVS